MLVRKYYLRRGGLEYLVEILDLKRNRIVVYANHLGLKWRGGGKKHHKDVYRKAPEPRAELLTTRICPGKSAPCGKNLRPEIVPHQSGFIAPGLLDLVCEAGHRFIVR
jgi:hypothetical protein